jgi:hypothetical protein
MNAPESRAARETAVLLVADDQQEIAEQVGHEILRGEFAPAAWAKALAAARAGGTEAAGEYARIRLDELTAHHQRRRAKLRDLEVRRLQSSSGVKSVKDLLGRRPVPRNLPVRRDVAGMAVRLLCLLFGAAGSIGCAVRLVAGRAAPEWTPVLALACGAGMVLVAVLARFTVPQHWVRMGAYRLGLNTLSALACLLSLGLGAKLMIQCPSAVPVRETARAGQPSAVAGAPAGPAVADRR